MTISATHQRQLGYEPLPELFQTNFSPEELASRRGAIFDRIGGDDIALLQGAAAPATSEFFRQTNDFFYLCGSGSTPCLLVARRSHASDNAVPTSP